MFCQKPNPQTGKQEWLIMEDDYDLRNEIARSTYGGMLHDEQRNMIYYAAVKKAIDAVKKCGKKANVLDIGTGTGILAMMAAECGADKVTACEVFKPMAETARKVIERNGLSSNINIICKSSLEMVVGQGKDMEEKANVLITEIFDTELIGEGVLPTLRHAHRELLETDAMLVPSFADVSIQLVESEALWEMHKLKDVKMCNNTNLKFPTSLEDCRGTASAFELHIDQVEDKKVLSDPYNVQRFDFTKPYYHTGNNKHTNTSQTRHTIRIKKDGKIHCVLLWWTLSLDKGGELQLTMVPKLANDDNTDIVWRDHWMQAVYFLPKLMQVKAGDDVDVLFCHDDYSIWFDVTCSASDGAADAVERPACSCRLHTNRDNTDGVAGVERPACSCGLHTSWSRERFAMMNDRKLRNTFRNFYRKHAKRLKHCLYVGDQSLMPLLLSDCEIDKITYIETSPMSKTFLEKVIALNGFGGQLEVIHTDGLPDETILDKCEIEQIDSLCGEPFFSSSLLPWHHLSFWYVTSMLKEKLNHSIEIYPHDAVLKCVTVEFKDLWKARAMVKNAVGFDLTPFDEIIEAALAPEISERHGPLHDVEPYPVWEYDQKMLSNPTTLMHFDFKQRVPKEDIIEKGGIRFKSSGTCHAVILWVDFNLDDEFSWTTGLTKDEDTSEFKWVHYSRQGVFLFKEPSHVNVDSTLEYYAVFNSKTADLSFRFAIT